MVERTINIDTEILNSIEKYIEEISKYYRIDYIILFGSYAKGTNHEDSDIDIAVISGDIKNRFNDGVKLMSLTWGINTKIEPHPIKTEEFRENETPFIDEIINTGIELYAA
jgi:predicted nucleotidyltransferase